MWFSVASAKFTQTKKFEHLRAQNLSTKISKSDLVARHTIEQSICTISSYCPTLPAPSFVLSGQTKIVNWLGSTNFKVDSPIFENETQKFCGTNFCGAPRVNVWECPLGFHTISSY